MRPINENKVVKFLKDGDANFRKACDDIPSMRGKEPTRRQASKWLMKKGIAYKTFKGIL